jgi:hypothetical protein
MVDDASAKALASIRYTDDSFTRRRLYTAWDSLGDEERFFDGVATLERYGVHVDQPAGMRKNRIFPSSAERQSDGTRGRSPIPVQVIRCDFTPP